MEALQHRRRLRTGIVQALYLLAGVALGGLLPSVAAGPTIESATVAPMLFGAAGGFISFIALVFSLLFLVVQYGNTSVSPRLTIFRDDPIVWHTFGFFTAVFAYCLVGGMTTDAAGDEVTILVPVIGIVLLMASLAMSRAIQLRALRLLQFNAIMEEVRARGQEVLTLLYRTPFQSDEVEVSGLPTAWEVRWEKPTTLLLGVDLSRLLKQAAELDALIELRAVPGQELRRGLVVAVARADHPIATCDVLSALSTGSDRDFTQDPLFALRLLNDISNRALSLSINDPATCVQVLGCIYDLLAQVADKQLDLGTISDDSGVPRVRLPFPAWEEFLTVGVDEVAHYSTHDPIVRARVETLLTDLLTLAPPQRQPPLRARLDRVLASSATPRAPLVTGAASGSSAQGDFRGFSVSPTDGGATLGP